MARIDVAQTGGSSTKVSIGDGLRRLILHHDIQRHESEINAVKSQVIELDRAHYRLQGDIQQLQQTLQDMKQGIETVQAAILKPRPSSASRSDLDILANTIDRRLS